MRIAPLQCFGLGDVIFCQSLANEWLEQGHTVVWGVLPQYVEGLQRAYPKVKFVDYTTLPLNYEARHEHDSGILRVIPLRWSVEICGVPYEQCMRSKYQMFNQPVENWRNGAMWQRDSKREAELLALVNSSGEPFDLVNETYQSDFRGAKKIDSSKLRAVKKINMSVVPGYSLFDWAGVIEAAEEVHTVSTSLFYLLEMLKLKSPAHLYPRNNDPDFSHISYLFTKEYILHR